MLHHTRMLRSFSVMAGYACRRARFPILIYHRVNDDGDPFFPAVPTAVFTRHIDYIARVYQVLPVEELVERCRRGGLPRNGLAITFDDGYRDVLTHAAPALRRHNLRATVFLATGFIGSGEAPWFDRLAEAIKLTRRASVRAPWGDQLELGERSQRLTALDRTLAYLKRVADEERSRCVDELLEELDAAAPARDLMLSWDDVHTLERMGFTIGAHTVNHPILSRVTPDRARAEIVGSRAMIEATCGAAPQAFAYPNGRPEDYTPAVQRAVAEAGFRCAVTTRFGVNNCATPAYEFRRGGPWEEDAPSFAFKLAAYRLLGG
jgi:peptidoglycan/xylan/chitin deacetylase (PgdA/CDA1 family)